RVTLVGTPSAHWPAVYGNSMCVLRTSWDYSTDRDRRSLPARRSSDLPRDGLPRDCPRPGRRAARPGRGGGVPGPARRRHRRLRADRKSTRLNSSHVKISYAVFCLKKKKSIHYARRSPMVINQTKFYIV